MSSGYPFPLNPASPASFLSKKNKLCCDVSGDYLLFYSWFYMNFPSFHWNIARIPVEIMIFATTFPFWWRATLVKFGWEVTPQRFLFEWKSTSEKFGREVVPLCFHFQSKSTSHAEVAPLHFYFWTDLWFPCYRRGQRSGHVHLPCAFSPHIRHPMQAKHENSWLPTYTALAPFSPSLMRYGISH